MPNNESYSISDNHQVIEGLFVHRDAIARHLNAPMLQERQAYLASQLALGRKPKHVSNAASLLCQVIRLVEQMNEIEVSEEDIVKAATRWLAETPSSCRNDGSRRNESFKTLARSWFRFLGLYVPRSREFCRFWSFHAEFVVGMRDEYGYLPTSIGAASLPTRRFLEWVSGRHERLSAIGQNDVDAFWDEGRKSGWRHQTVKCNCQALRTFFRYAEHRGWSYKNLSKTIKAPIMRVPLSPPKYPECREVRRLIRSLSTSHPSRCRAKAIVLLASVYGMRSCEISRLTLEDLDWCNEILTVRRAKHGRVQQFPIQYEVGQAIIHYLQKVRPPSRFRNVFLTLSAPYRPVQHLAQSMWRVLRLGVFIDIPCGLHSLRHACATQLLRKGSSLQAIADLLGHRNMRSVSIYAHCDARSLRKVADFSLKDVV